MKARTFLLFFATTIFAGSCGFRNYLRSRANQEQIINPYTVCGNIAGLSSTQARLCSKDPSSVASAIQGMKIAIHECKHQFKNDRWNCSALETKNNIPHTSQFLSSGRGYRETAFSYAIASAGVAHQVAHACSLGKIEGCECVPPQPKSLTARQRKIAIRKFRQGKENGRAQDVLQQVQTFERAGCDDNVNYGIQFSSEFLDSREDSRDLISKTRLHNNRVGRLIVSNNMRKSCKCHGQSGSCSQKTCWRATPNFKAVGEEIRRKYEKAVIVKPRHFSNKAREGNAVEVSQGREEQLPIESLVFFEESPDYCEANPSIDVQGTRGRYCNATAERDDPSSCAHLCCNRGHTTIKVKRTEQCRCRFHWCCYVNCDMCEWTELVSRCN